MNEMFIETEYDNKQAKIFLIFQKTFRIYVYNEKRKEKNENRDKQIDLVMYFGVGKDKKCSR